MVVLFSIISMISTYYLHDSESVKIKAALFVSPFFYLTGPYYFLHLLTTPNEITLGNNSIEIDGKVYSLGLNTKCSVLFNKASQAEFEITINNKKTVTTSFFINVILMRKNLSTITLIMKMCLQTQWHLING